MREFLRFTLLRMIGWVFASVLCLTLSGCSSLLYYPSPQSFVLRDKLVPQPQDVSFVAEDGVRLHGWYFHAVERSGERVKSPKGVLLFFHGNAQNLSAHFANLYWILGHGYDFFIFDYRGYGNSEGKPLPEGTVLDGRAALKWLAQKADRPKRMIVFGQSLGGAIALRVAGEMASQTPLDRVVVDSTFSSYQRVARKVLQKHWLTWLAQWMPYVVLSDRYSPVDSHQNWIAKISPTPLLVVHGDADLTVDYAMGEEVFDLAQQPKEFWRIEGGGHTDFLFREGGANRARLLNWLDGSFVL